MSERITPPEDAPDVPSTDARPVRRGAAVLLVLAYAALVYLPFLGSARTLTSHEVMVTQPALRILHDGDWIVPRYASGHWLDKPPLVNWLTALSFAALGGFSEFAARLPAALSAIGLCVLVFYLTDRFYSRRAAVFAGLMQATCVYMYMQGRLGEIDMVFALFVTGAHAVLLWRWGRGRFDLPLAPATLFYVLAALAVLAKGFLGAALIACTVFAFCLIRRSLQPLRATLFTPGIVAFFLIALGWHVAAYLTVGDEALEEWKYNSLLRFLGLHHLGQTRLPIFYLYSVPWLVLPWSIALIVGARVLWREARRREARAEHFLWAWFLGGFVLLSIALFKQEHYAIPILPPLTVLAAHLLDVHYGQIGVHRRRFLVGVFVALPLVFGAVGSVVLPARDHRRETVDFTRTATAQVPAAATLYVIGLGQSSAYPYIEHDDCVYIDSVDGVLNTLRERDGRPMWVLAPRQHLDVADAYDLHVELLAGEPAREKHPWEETLVLGKLTFASGAAATRPAE